MWYILFMTEVPRLIDSIRTAVRGSSLADQLKIERWQRFRSEETTAEWIALLGLTAIVLTHQEYFTDFIAQWVKELDSEAMLTLLKASSIHDLGEISIGDVPEPHKNLQDEKSEASATIKLIDQLENLDVDQRTELKRAYEQVVVGENVALHLIFKAFERLEYLDTAVHVFMALNSGLRMDKGEYMIARVLAFDLPKIMIMIEQFPNSIGMYLRFNRETIHSMFDYCRSSVDTEFQEKFEDSQRQWQTYCGLIDSSS